MRIFFREEAQASQVMIIVVGGMTPQIHPFFLDRMPAAFSASAGQAVSIQITKKERADPKRRESPVVRSQAVFRAYLSENQCMKITAWSSKCRLQVSLKSGLDRHGISATLFFECLGQASPGVPSLCVSTFSVYLKTFVINLRSVTLEKKNIAFVRKAPLDQEDARSCRNLLWGVYVRFILSIVQTILTNTLV